MKKAILWLLAVLFVFAAVSGCKKQDPDPSSAENASTEAGSTDPTEESGEEEIDMDYGKYLTEDGFIRGYAALNVLNEGILDSIEIKASDVAVSEDEVTMNMKDMLASYFPTEDKTRAVSYGDCVIMDYSGKLNGEVFDGGTATDQPLVAGSDSFVDNFLTKIIGHMPGETFDIDIRFPDTYSSTELAGQMTVFTVTVKYIANPELTDAFVTENKAALEEVLEAEINSPEDVRKAERAILEKEKKRDALRTAIQALPITNLPKELTDNARHLMNLQTYSQYGISLEELAGYYGMGEEELREIVEESCKLDVIFHWIAEKEHYTAEEEEFLTVLKITPESLESLIGLYGKPYLKYCILNEKAINYLIEYVKVVE